MKILNLVATVAFLSLPLGLAGIANALPVDKMAQHNLLSHRSMMYQHHYHHHHMRRGPMMMHHPMIMHRRHPMMRKPMMHK